jgi:ornithine cyclodeaminase/alanine dehydrogenase-like protein (mu-crystallin family)
MTQAFSILSGSVKWTFLMRVFDVEATAAALPFPSLINALEIGFAEGCVFPQRHHHTIRVPEGTDATLLLMPAWHDSGRAVRYLGIKLVTVYPDNSAKGLPGLSSTYLLYEAETGQPVAMMDGNVITARRTVATSALAARYLARPDSRHLLIVGAGRVASLIAQAYLVVRPIEQVTIWDIAPTLATSLASTLSKQGFNACATTDLKAAVRCADIVSAATLATQPLISGAWLRPGAHLDLIGGFTPAMREADDEAIARSSIYVDTREALHEAGDLVQPMNAGIVSEVNIRGTLSDLTRKRTSGRRFPNEITCFKAVGSALADLISGTIIYEGPATCLVDT